MTTVQIFVPEVVPLDNRGEEAILRGFQDVLFPGRNVHFHVLGYRRIGAESHGDITIYPYHWFYPVWVFRELYLSWHPQDILNLIGVVTEALRNRLPFLASQAHLAIPFNRALLQSSFLARFWKERRSALQKLAGADYVLAGHDNALGLREAHLLRAMAHSGVHYGIFGCGMNSRFPNATVASVYAKAFSSADFLFFRDHATWKGVRDGCGLAEARLAPDPAFGMKPADEADVDALFRQANLGEFFGKPVVAMTVVENAVIMRSFRAQRNVRQKAEMHHRLVARLVEHLTRACGAHVLFLPHCVGPTPRLDDRRVARSVLRHCHAPPGTVRVLETASKARLLKGLMKRCDFLIGERTHSLIGAVSLGLPFICLGSLSDKRTSEIIGTMCGASDLVFDLADPSPGELCAFTEQIWNTRSSVRNRVAGIAAKIGQELENAAIMARAGIARHCTACISSS